MDYDANYSLKSVLLLVLLCLWLPSCQDQFPEPSFSYTKSNRKKLGNKLAETIRTNEAFRLLDSSIPSNKKLLNHLNGLYRQAYHNIRHDKYASNEDKWDDTIPWDCNVLISDKKMAFCIPGGDFYVTTGLLEGLIRADFHLLYFMAFEVELMNAGLLYNKLAEFPLNDEALGEIAEMCVSTDRGITDVDLLNDIINEFTYSGEDVVKELDILAMNNICLGSRFLKEGIAEMTPTDNILWFKTRPPYEGRIQLIYQDLESGHDCGPKRCDYAHCPINKLIDDMIY